MCRCRGRRKKTSPVKKAPIKAFFGETGLTMIEVTPKDAEPVLGKVTNVVYPFHQKSRIYVDDRDIKGFEVNYRVIETVEEQ